MLQQVRYTYIWTKWHQREITRIAPASLGRFIGNPGILFQHSSLLLYEKRFVTLHSDSAFSSKSE